MGRNYDLMRDAAYRRKGEDMRDAIIAWETTKRVAPFAFGAAVLGGLGYAVYWLWTSVVTPLFTGDTVTFPSLPGAIWGALLILVGGLFWIFRPGRSGHLGTRVLELAVLAIVVLGAIGYGLASMFA